MAKNLQSGEVLLLENLRYYDAETHPDNDPTGKKREALEDAMNCFNTTGLNSLDEFYAVIKDAARLLDTNTVSQTSEETVANPYSSTPQTSITPNTFRFPPQ